MDTIRHEYRLKWWVQAWYSALGIFLIVIGGQIISDETVHADWHVLENWRKIVMPGALAALGCYMIALALRSRVFLEATRVTVRYVIRKKSADIADIIGCQTYPIKKLSFWLLQYRGTSFWHLKLKGSGGYISIVQLFNVDRYFYSWLQNLPALDNLSLSL